MDKNECLLTLFIIRIVNTIYLFVTLCSQAPVTAVVAEQLVNKSGMCVWVVGNVLS